MQFFLRILAASCVYILFIVISSDVLDKDLYTQDTPDYSIDADKALTTCILQWNLNTLKKKWDLRITEAPIFFSCKNAKFYSEHLFGHMIFAYPLSFFVESPYALHEITYQLNRFIIAISIFLLCCYLTSSFSVSLVAGALMISGWHFGQLQNTGLGWAILAMLFFIKHLRDTKWKSAIGFAAFAVLAALSSGYLLLFTPIALLILFLARTIATRTIPSRRWFLQIACVLIFVLLVISPVLLIYKRVQDEYGFKRTTYTIAKFAPNFLSSAAKENPQQHEFVYPLSWIVCTQILFAFGILATRNRVDYDKWKLGFCLLGVFSFWMASFKLSPFLLLSGLPGFNGLRALMRWTLFLAVSITVLNAMVFAFLSSKWKSNTKAAVTLFLLIGIMLTMAYEQPLRKNPRFRHSEVQAFLATIPKGPICILPLPNKLSTHWPRITSARMLFQLNHRLPMISGYSGFSPRLIDVMERKISESGLSEPIILNLSKTGVMYLVVDSLGGDTSGICEAIRSLRNVRILYDKNGEMVAQLPRHDQVLRYEELLRMWRKV